MHHSLENIHKWLLHTVSRSCLPEGYIITWSDAIACNYYFLFEQKFCHLDKLSLTTQSDLGYVIYKPGISPLRIYRDRYWNNVKMAIFHWRWWKCLCLRLFPISFQQHSNYNFNSSLKKIFWQHRKASLMFETCLFFPSPLTLLFFKPMCLYFFLIIH